MRHTPLLMGLLLRVDVFLCKFVRYPVITKGYCISLDKFKIEIIKLFPGNNLFGFAELLIRPKGNRGQLCKKSYNVEKL